MSMGDARERLASWDVLIIGKRKDKLGGDNVREKMFYLI